ncbi:MULTISPECIES: Txe/YoeB family addiction module toxin [Selenomonas]|uniref:Txe/YoeB family addiction module toxin n=1 Tax=Selenomonas TaxID=970 RepID=UPI00027C635D|nr:MULTISPECIES: Txe/YoeB family addiction module toxin [Selenomonas]EJU30835.1 addiction module toxin, Txe/YoeB family [Selenomonas sp. CM52]UZE46607.1 Txe/YoeB family addiction module toxin [Selenomonas sputigena]
MNKVWSDDAWEEYIAWQMQDKKTLKRINLLLKDVERHPFEGLGKPEPLRGELSGFWSRRIDEKNRLLYRVSRDSLEILSCKGHYD